MSKSTRMQVAQRELEALEPEFERELIAALRRCASGIWGLFGQNDASFQRAFGKAAARYESEDAKRIDELGTRIEDLRRTTLAEPYVLWERFKEYRSRRGPNELGEPRLASLFLEELPPNASQ